jgi:hypothetical protein
MDLGKDFFNSLADEVLLHLFSFLPDTDSLFRTVQSCRRFYNISFDLNHEFWRKLYCEKWCLDPRELELYTHIRLFLIFLYLFYVSKKVLNS